MTVDWNQAALGLKCDVGEHGGFLTIQKDSLRDRFGIGRLTKVTAQDLLTRLREHGMILFPDPYDMQGTSLRIYDVKSEIGTIAMAVAYPQGVPGTALAD